MTQTLIEQLEALETHDFSDAMVSGEWIHAEDLRAIIEQANREAVDPVARVTALSNLGFSTMGQVEWIGNKYSLPPDALLYAAPQPDHTKLIGELTTALHWAIENIDQRLLSNDMAKYEAMLKAKRTRDLAREAIK